MTFLLQMAGAMLVGLLIAWWRARRARRSRAELTEAGTTSVPARVALEGGRARSGRLVLAGTRAVWASRRGGSRVDLGGAQLLSAGPASGWNSPQDAVDLRLSLSGGGTATVLVDSDLAELLIDVLPRSAPSVPARDPRAVPAVAKAPGRSWWAWALVAAAVLALAYSGCTYATGYSTTATVTGGDREPNDGLCPVVWEDPQQVPHSGEADCLDEASGTDDVSGTALDVRISGWPDSGDPSTPGLYAFMAIVLGGPPLTVGTWRLLYLRGRRRAWLAATAPSTSALPDSPSASALPPGTPLPALTAHELRTGNGEQPGAVLARLAPYAARQVPGGGWSHPRRPDGARTAVPVVRFMARLWVPLVVGAGVLLITWPQPQRWWVLQTQETASARGTSTGEVVFDGFGPLPGELTVEFPGPDGATVRTDVATSSHLPAGQPVQVGYAVGDPGRARLQGPDDDLGRGALLGAGLVAGSVLLAAGRVVPLVRWRSRVRRARTAPARPALALLTADPGGRPLVLLADPVVAPLRFAAVPLSQPLPAGAAGALHAGVQVSVHGRLTAGEPVVLAVAGVPAALLPAGPAVDLDAGDLLHLLDAAHALAPDEKDTPATDPVAR